MAQKEKSGTKCGFYWCHQVVDTDCPVHRICGLIPRVKRRKTPPVGPARFSGERNFVSANVVGELFPSQMIFREIAKSKRVQGQVEAAFKALLSILLRACPWIRQVPFVHCIKLMDVLLDPALIHSRIEERLPLTNYESVLVLSTHGYWFIDLPKG